MDRGNILPHALLGHPLAGVLSAIGFKRAAEWVHYRTLPWQLRRLYPHEEIEFKHGIPHWDLLGVPLCTLFEHLGSDRAAGLVVSVLGTRDVIAARACGTQTLVEIVKLYRNGKRDFTDADLYSADLGNTDLSGVCLKNATLSRTKLCGANLQGADLRNIFCENADWSGADLSGTDLRGAFLVDSNLRDADLRGARLDWIRLSGTDLRGALLDDPRYVKSRGAVI